MQQLNQSAPFVSEGIHLNIGCGEKVWDGFVNIDFPNNWCDVKPDIECDVRKLDLPDNYADSAYSIHVLEHIHRWETEGVLREWARVLKPGGKLVIEVPCLDKILGIFLQCKQGNLKLIPSLTIHRLYGDPSYKNEAMMHKWCFSSNELIDLMRSAGLHDVELSQPKYHMKQADMRVTGTK